VSLLAPGQWLRRVVVETSGFEPPTSALRTRRSPS
jgi:hypothetical protein